MPKQIYEDYWEITLAYTDFNGQKFLDTLRICVEFIDTNKHIIYIEDKYQNLQQLLIARHNINEISVRKAVNQLVKMGFIEPFLIGYHPLCKDYLASTTNRKRKSLLSKIIYSNSSLSSAVNRQTNTHEINFLIKTLVENSPLNREDIVALMLANISSFPRGYLKRHEIDAHILNARRIGFFERKYNQIGYLYNLLKKLDNLVFVGDDLYFEDDAKQIFGEDLRETIKKRDPYLHRIYKNQLQEESESIYGNNKCMVEGLSYPVLIASHIKPFIDSNENETYDPNNGILLSRTMDSLFDLKYISFNNDGSIIFSSTISSDVQSFWQKYRLDSRFLNQERLKYLEYHRNLLLQ